MLTEHTDSDLERHERRKKDGKVEVQTAVNSAGIPMPPSKKRKLGSENDLMAPSRSAEEESVEDDVEMEDAGQAEHDEWSTEDEQITTGSGSAASEPDTEDEIAYAQRKKKSKKTAKRKFRATEPGQFGNTLEALLNTAVPGTSATPLALKPSIKRRKKEEKKEMIAKKAMEGEKRAHEEIGRITDVIGGWGGENERSLRKVAQRGGEFLFRLFPESALTLYGLASGAVVQCHPKGTSCKGVGGQWETCFTRFRETYFKRPENAWEEQENEPNPSSKRRSVSPLYHRKATNRSFRYH